MLESELKILTLKFIAKEKEEFIVASEVPFYFSERRADIALLENNNLTAFEIKGERDNIVRLKYQIDSYKQFFDYCYIVCEKKNLAEIRKSIPQNIGILLATEKELSMVRKSKKFIRHNKMTLASFLNVKKLKSLDLKKSGGSKQHLCELISKNLPLDQLRALTRVEFKERYRESSDLFRLESTESLNTDDLYTITKRAPSKLVKVRFS